ncbi:MAG TPA: hypothetical protein VN894_07170 [Polyangiaceae bacterium]|nr:hypothetical protein [Polyangiaceae bacterium]
MRVFTFALFCAAATGVGGRVYAQEAREAVPEPEYTLEDRVLRITQGGSSSTVDLGCVGRSAMRTGAKLFVACGAAGVVELDLSDPLAPRRDGTMPVDGNATSLFLHDGLPWVEVAHVDARPVRIGAGGPGALPAQTIFVATPSPARAAAPASPAKEPESIVAPTRRGGLWELSLLTSAFVAFGSLGVGQLGSASVAYRFESPIVLRAEIAPFGIAGPSTTTSCCSGQFSQSTSSSGGAVTVFAANLLLALDTQFVEVGLGVGGASVNLNNTFNSGGGTPQTGSVQIVESARIGARDGLALNLASSAIAVNSQFNLGYFVTSVQIPVSAKAMLIARGGGGNVGFGYGDLGVRVLVRGDGGKGTIALTGFAGAALIQENLCSSNPDPPFSSSCTSATLVGPSLGGGVEWRL